MLWFLQFVIFATSKKQNMKKVSFASRLSRKIVLITSLIFVVALAVMNVQSVRISKKNSVQYSTEILRYTMKDIESTIQQTEKISESIAASIEAFNRSGVKMDTANFFRLLENSVADNPNILGLGVYYEPHAYAKKSKHCGVYVNRDEERGMMVHEYDDDASFAEDGWNYFEMDWYTSVKESGRSVWISPFLDVMDTKDSLLMTTYSVPLTDIKGEIYGVCAVDLSLNWLKDQLASLKPYPKSNIVLADSELNFICNPMSTNPFNGSMYDTPFVPGMDWTVTPGQETFLWEEMEQDGSITLKHKGTTAFCVFGKMENGWILAANSLYSDAFHDIYILLFFLLGLSIAGILILYFSSRSIINTAALPIVEFASAASKITDGRFDVPIIEVDTNDEMMDLGNALRFMQKSVTDYIEQLKITTSEKERLASELNVARTIQAQMLCTHFPRLSKGGIYASSIPAREVGGDLYDFVVNGNELYFILGDVSGKGVPAALLMAITIAAFRASGKKGHSTSEIVSLINNTFCRSNTDLMFVTLVVGKIDMTTGEMDFCNAGHNPMVLITPDGKAGFIKARSNVACGVMEDFPYAGESMSVAPGSRLIIYSDGITEAEDAVKNQYGDDRLLEWAAASDINADDSRTIENLSASVHAFTKGAEQNDDMTMMSISF